MALAGSGKLATAPNPDPNLKSRNPTPEREARESSPQLSLQHHDTSGASSSNPIPKADPRPNSHPPRPNPHP